MTGLAMLGGIKTPAHFQAATHPFYRDAGGVSKRDMLPGSLGACRVFFGSDSIP